MLDFFQVFILAIVQGFTEFLPVSSSAHLIFVPKLLGWPDQGLAFDVAVHIGTLIALLAYFRKELMAMLRDFFSALFGKAKLTANAKLLWAIGFATIPVGIAGILLKETVETTLRSPVVIAVSTIFFGILLFWADFRNQKKYAGCEKSANRIQNELQNGVQSNKLRDEHNINWRDVLLIGLGQTLSLIPGTSRSGITLTAGLMTGLSRESAARFSFLLAIPVIILAGGYEAFSLMRVSEGVDWNALCFGILISAISGYLCIHYFIKLLNSLGVMPFVIYRLLLGLVLLSVFV